MAMSRLWKNVWQNWLVRGALLLGLLTAGWWYFSGPSVGKVSGIVRFKDEVLKSDDAVTWTVHFVTEDGTRFTGLVDRYGQYTVRDVLPGPVKIVITGDPAMPPGLYAPGKAPPPDRALENRLRRLQRYNDPDKSRLTYTVAKGSQPHDITLTD
jgi:hypothetical protein